MVKKWVLKPRANPEVVQHLSKVLNINHYLSKLLVQRGITDYEEAKAFFRPRLQNLHDPFLMKDMTKAVERIEKAIIEQEKILVYGDYDVDGTTAVALIYTFLKGFYKNVDFYIPDRYTEGYGVSKKGVDFAAEHNFRLVIALDCGIKAVKAIAYAKEKNIDFIVCDHHLPGEILPEASALLDPKQTDCPYPYKELSGCGLGFKLAQAFSAKNGLPFKRLESFLDLVVVSIAADIVPITGENRILAYYGLKLINTNPRPGLRAILKLGNVFERSDAQEYDQTIFTRELQITDLVFLIGPRINAAGRMESGRNSVELLITTNMEDADKKGEIINKYNDDRRNLDAQITQEALEQIANSTEFDHKKTTVVYNPAWHKGVLGIVASRLIDYYYRPTIVFTSSGDLVTGSARSVKDFDIYTAIDSCSDILEHYGGHRFAAGLSLRPENLPVFISRFESMVATSISDKMLVPEIEIDDKIVLSSFNSKFYKVLKQFSPFGPENMKPIFLAEGVKDTGYASVVGKNHLRMFVFHPEISSFPVPAIAFQQGEKFEKVQKGIPFDICFHLEENEWNGNVTLQLNIKDIRFADEPPLLVHFD